MYHPIRQVNESHMMSVYTDQGVMVLIASNYRGK